MLLSVRCLSNPDNRATLSNFFPHRHDHSIVHALVVASGDGAWGGRGSRGWGRPNDNVETHPAAAAAKAAKQWAAASSRALGGAKNLPAVLDRKWVIEQLQRDEQDLFYGKLLHPDPWSPPRGF